MKTCKSVTLPPTINETYHWLTLLPASLVLNAVNHSCGDTERKIDYRSPFSPPPGTAALASSVSQTSCGLK